MYMKSEDYIADRISCFDSKVRSSPNKHFLLLRPFTNGRSIGNSCRAPSGEDKTVQNEHTLRKITTYM